MLSTAVIAAVALPILAGLLLQVGVIQNYAVGQLTKWLSEKGGTAISIDRVDIGFFNRAVLEGIYVQDPSVPQDTLLYARRLSVGIDGINFFNGNIALGAVSLSDGVLHIAKDSTGVTNLRRVTERFRAKKPRKSTCASRRGSWTSSACVSPSGNSTRPRGNTASISETSTCGKSISRPAESPCGTIRSPVVSNT